MISFFRFYSCILNKFSSKELIILLALTAVCFSAYPQSALNLTGTNAYVTFGNNSRLGLSQFTLECWFMKKGTGLTTTTGTGGITAIPLITKGKSESDGSTVDCNYFFGINAATNTLAADFEEGSGGTTPGLNHPIIGTTVLSDNVWYHGAVTYDGTTWKLYLNGLAEGSLTVSRPVQNLSIQHSGIGTAMDSKGTASGFFNGTIDEVRIWNVARSLTQIQSTVNSQISSPQTSLVAGWRLDEGAGTIVNDIAGNAITGTIKNTGFSWSTQTAPFNINLNPDYPPAINVNGPADNDNCRSSTTANLSVTVSDQNTSDQLTVKFYGRPKKGPGKFTLVGIPDTQFYTEETNGGKNSTFKAQTKWIVDNKNSLNIAHVSQLGDCVQNGDNNGNNVEWERADTSMRIIENPVTTNLPFGVPYTMNVGNHDQTPGGSASGTTNFFNQYFGVARFSGRDYWGGNYGSNADNSYQLFSAEGIDFIAISLEYDVNADPAVLSWANNLLKTYSNRKAIIVSHWIINSDGTFGAQGAAIYNALKANPNLMLMLCGHVNPNGEARRTDVYNGNTVHTLLSDYQDRTNGGNGWMRIMAFNPSDNTIDVKTYSPTLNQYETDANSQFTLTNVNLYNNPAPYQLLSVQSATPGSTINYSWSGLPADSTFEWYATVADTHSTVSSNLKTFSTYLKPTVNLGPDQSLKCGEQTTLDAQNSGSNFLWSNGATVQSITVNTSGIYSVKVTNPISQCFNSDTVKITRTPVLTISGLKSMYSDLDAPVSIKGFPEGGIFSGQGISENQFIPALAKAGGPYTITYTYTDSSGCVSTVTASVSVFSLPQSIQWGSVWKYKDNGSDQGTTWRNPSFNDSLWASGPAQLGYGDGDEATLINACGTVTALPTCSNKYTTTYFRRQIYIPDVNTYSKFTMNMLRDDGIVVYINGNEVYRNNMPAGNVTYTTLASTAASDDGQTIQNTTLTLAASKLVDGLNTIAVEIHQNAGSSSDVTFDMELKGVVPPPGGAFLSRGPYLQSATSNSIIIRWRTDDATDSKVTYGTDTTNLSLSAMVSGTRTEHTVTLSDLQPYTKYYYSVGSSLGKIQGGAQNYFVTSPLAGTEGKYTFWVAGDCGNNSTNQINVMNRYNAYIGNNITNGWLLLGDNAYDGGLDNEFTGKFFNIYQNTIMKHAPLWPVPGNHDYNNNATRQDDHNMPYYDIFNLPRNGEAGGVPSNTEAFYSYDYGNIHFLALDSYGEESNLRLYDTLGTQVQWIKQDLAANTSKWTIAYWHHPPYTMGSHNSDTESELVKMRTNFIRILERNGVDMILCGHSHDYERSKLMKGHYGSESTFNPDIHNISQSSGKYDGSANSCTYLKDDSHTMNGSVYVVSGSAGQLGGTQASFPHNALPFSDATNGGSLVLEIDGSRLDAKWLCADGVIRDKFTIMKDAGKVRTLSIALGDSVELAASWNGQYIWSHTDETTSKVFVKPTANTEYVVTDQYQCVADTFKIAVNIPVISSSLAGLNLCSEKTVNIPFSVTGKFASGNTFTAQLSDSSGSFETPVDIGSITGIADDTIRCILPANISTTPGYSIRIVSSAPSVTGYAGNNIYIGNRPTVTLSADDIDYKICNGDSIKFSAQASAGVYEYFIDNISQTTVSEDSMYITSSLSDGQVVMVKTYNICGADSASKTMTVLPLPDNTIDVTGPLTFCQPASVTFNAKPGNNYEWLKNDSIIAGISGEVYSTNTSGNYSVKIYSEDGCSARSEIFAVNAMLKTEIISTSPNLKICPDETAVFNIGVAGTNLTYQWMERTSPGTYINVFENSLFSGTNTNTLTITGLNSSASKTFRCNVSGTCGQELSPVRSVIVYPSTEIINQPVNMTGCKGKSVTFSIGASGTNLKYIWQKKLPTGTFVNLATSSIYSNTDKPELTIKGLTNEFNGYIYRCLVTGPCGTLLSNEVTLTIGTCPVLREGDMSPENDLNIQSLTIIPNPATEQFRLMLTLPAVVSYSWEIHNLSNVLVESGTIETNSKSIHVNTAAYKEGVYFISLHLNNGEVLREKLIVIH